MSTYSLLTENNVKILKGEGRGFYSVILHLAPADLSGYQVCPLATAGCKASCLNTAGHGGMFKAGETTNKVQECRKRRTRMFFEHREQFMALLVTDIRKAEKRAEKRDLTLVVRLNGTSDIAWEKIRVGEHRNVMAVFPHLQFYDYTKIAPRMSKVGTEGFPVNYHLTFSWSEDNKQQAIELSLNGYNVAVPVMPDVEHTVLQALFPASVLVNGDETDLRFLDVPGSLVILKAKGRAKKDVTGFVVRNGVDFRIRQGY